MRLYDINVAMSIGSLLKLSRRSAKNHQGERLTDRRLEIILWTEDYTWVPRTIEASLPEARGL